MILNLSDVLSEQHKAIHESVPIEMTCFKSEMGDYAITEKTPLELSVEYAGDRKLEVTGKAEITSVAPCDRCLEADWTRIFDVGEDGAFYMGDYVCSDKGGLKEIRFDKVYLSEDQKKKRK